MSIMFRSVRMETLHKVDEIKGAAKRSKRSKNLSFEAIGFPMCVQHWNKLLHTCLSRVRVQKERGV